MIVDLESIIGVTDLLGVSPDRVVAVLIGYFDDSGTDAASPVAVMGGYVARMKDWKSFERQTKKLFDSEKIEFFRAKMFEHNEQQFRGWNDARKLRFASEWHAIAGQYLFRGIVTGVLKSDFQKAKGMDKTLPSISETSGCAQQTIQHLIGDRDVWAAIKKHKMSVVIESSSVADGGLEVDLSRLIAANELEHIESVSFVKKRAVRALQIADYLAYYGWRRAVAVVGKSQGEINPYLEIAHSGGPKIIMKLSHKFEPNPAYRAKLAALLCAL